MKFVDDDDDDDDDDDSNVNTSNGSNLFKQLMSDVGSSKLSKPTTADFTVNISSITQH